MRAGFFTEVYHPVVNGVVASIDALAGGLRALGNEVYCFAPSVPGYEEGDAPVYRIPSLPLPAATPYRLTLPVVSRRRRHAIINRLHVVHAHSPFVTGWMAMRYARRLRIPLVYTYHTRLEEYVHYVPFEANAARRAASTLTRNYANGADAVIAPTSAMRDLLLEAGVVAPIEVIPTGIDLRAFASGERSETLRRRLGARDGQRLLLTVSRLAREKNIELLIEGLAYAQGTVLAIAGAGPHREALEQHARRLGVHRRAVFTGAIDRTDLPGLYASADAFVFASTTETQGIVLAEALAAGAYVVAADAPQVREVLGDAGLIVPPDARAFGAAFEGIPECPDRERSFRARVAAERFGIEQQAGRVAAIYARLQPRKATAGAG